MLHLLKIIASITIERVKKMTLNLKKTIASICIIILTGLFLCPTQVYAQISNKQELEISSQNVMKYMELTDDNLLIFNEEAALQNNESASLINSCKLLEQISRDYATYNSGIETYDLYLPIYGYFCGPGVTGEEGVTPISYLDDQCRIHDECYSKDYYSCDCDQTLLDGIALKFHLMSGAEKEAAIAINAYFTAALANPSAEGDILSCKQ